MSTTVKKYKGDRRLRRGIAKMTANGWSVDAQSSRKRMWSWTTGIFTRKQIHMVTFRRDTA